MLELKSRSRPYRRRLDAESPRAPKPRPRSAASPSCHRLGNHTPQGGCVFSHAHQESPPESEKAGAGRGVMSWVEKDEREKIALPGELEPRGHGAQQWICGFCEQLGQEGPLHRMATLKKSGVA